MRLSRVKILLAAGKDEAARGALQRALSRAAERAGRIGSPEWRKSFYLAAPDHAELVALAREWRLPTVY